MKKILFVVESLSGGGAEKVLTTIIKNLNKEKYDVTVYSIVKTGVYVKDIENYCDLKYALKDYNHCSMFGKFFYKLKIKLIYSLNIDFVYRWLIKEKYDIEIAFVEGFDTKLVAASHNKKSKKYAWVHCDLIANPHTNIHYKSIDDEREVYTKFDKIFAVSNDVKKSFIKKFKINNITVQYNPIDSFEIINKSMEKQNVLKNDCLNLITIGRLEKQKGYDRILKIAKKLKQEGYEFKLYILGKGSLKDDFDKYIVKHNLSDCIKLLGFKKNPYKYLKCADIFICSSYAEGFSTVATEAMILGIPIVTTNCSGMKELFGKYNCGIIANNDENSLFNSIKYIFDNPLVLKYYKSQINERKKYFDIVNRVKEIEDVFDQ